MRQDKEKDRRKIEEDTHWEWLLWLICQKLVSQVKIRICCLVSGHVPDCSGLSVVMFRLAPWWIEFCFWLQTSRDRTGKYNSGYLKYVFAKSQLDRTLDLFCVQVKLKICLCVIVPRSVSSRVHFTAQTRLVSDDDCWENLRRQHLYQHLSNWSQFVPIHFYHFTLFTIILQHLLSSFRVRLSSVPKWNCAFSSIC